MKKTYLNHIVCILLMLSTISGKSQGSLSAFLLGPFKEKKTITYGLNNRRTTLLNDRSTIYGGYVGVKFGSQLKHVITLNSNLFWAGKDETINGFSEVQLNYIGFAEEYQFWKKNNWLLSSYLHGGIGQARLRGSSLNESLTDALWVYPIEVGIHGGFSPIEWCELRIGGGYRYVFSKSNLPLNGWYYKVGAGINLEVLKKDIMKLKNSIRQFQYPTH